MFSSLIGHPSGALVPSRELSEGLLSGPESLVLEGTMEFVLSEIGLTGEW